MHKNHNDKKTYKCKRIVMGLYVITVTLVIIMMMFNVFVEDRKKSYYGLSNFRNITNSWVDEKGNKLSYFTLFKYAGAKDKYLDEYYTLPYNIKEDQSIVIRSHNTYITVLVDDKVIYQTEKVSSQFCNNSPGTRWNIINIRKEYSGKVVKLRIRNAYTDHRAKVDSIFIGDKCAIIVYIIEKKVFELAASFLMLFIGILFCIFSFVINKIRKIKDHSMNYLGLFAVFCSIWCIVETNVIQLFINNLGVLQTIEDAVIVLGSIPFLFYADSLYNIFRYKIVRALCIVDIMYVFLSSLMHMFGILDFHQALYMSHVMYASIAVILTVCILKQAKGKKQSGVKIDSSSALKGSAIIILLLSVIFDIIRYHTTSVMDKSYITRLGLLNFIIIFGTENIREMMRLVKQGTQAEIISKLAYKDGLTNVGNRTAYKEELDNILIEFSNMKIGIVMFDINNLKSTNDNTGHHEGDELIKICSKIIVDTFGSEGKVYRIGGDEFVCIITKENPQNIYSEKLAEFNMAIEKENKDGNYPFKISIAHGVSYFNANSKHDIYLAQEKADKEMYKNKNQIKSITEIKSVRMSH